MIKILEYNIQNNTPKVVVVCCVHGDEFFGARVFGYYKKYIKKFSGLRVIFANTRAYQKGRRFIDQDLNRIFPGKTNGNYEERLAHKLLPFISKAQYVLDIHTTTSDIMLTPIIANYNKSVKKIINLCKSKEVVQMEKKLASHSLIGQVKSGVSLEYGEGYAKNNVVLLETVMLISKLLKNKKDSMHSRKIYRVSKTIPLMNKLPEGARNFEYIKKYKLYPFLLYEKSYTDHQGFYARSYTEKLI